MYKLLRLKDNLKMKSNMIIWVNDNKRSDIIESGSKLVMFNSFNKLVWETTPVLLFKETEEEIKFSSQNSDYVLMKPMPKKQSKKKKK